MPLQFCKKAFPPCQTLIIYALLGSTKASRAISNEPGCVRSLIKRAAPLGRALSRWGCARNAELLMSESIKAPPPAAGGSGHGRSRWVPATTPDRGTERGCGCGTRTAQPRVGGTRRSSRTHPRGRARGRARVCSHVPGVRALGGCVPRHTCVCVRVCVCVCLRASDCLPRCPQRPSSSAASDEQPEPAVCARLCAPFCPADACSLRVPADAQICARRARARTGTRNARSSAARRLSDPISLLCNPFLLPRAALTGSTHLAVVADRMRSMNNPLLFPSSHPSPLRLSHHKRGKGYGCTGVGENREGRHKDSVSRGPE